MPILWRRISISSASDFRSRSSPSSRTSPAVGSTRRDRHRTIVDLPDPESPMITNISPTWTSKLTSALATMCPAPRMVPARAPASASVPPAPEPSKNCAGCGPYTFQTFLQRSFTSPGSLTWVFIGDSDRKFGYAVNQGNVLLANPLQPSAPGQGANPGFCASGNDGATGPAGRPAC